MHGGETSALEKCRTDSAQVRNALDVLKLYAPVKTSTLAPRPDVSVQDLLDDSALEDCLALAERLTTWDSRIKRLSALETRENTFVESLLPWEPLMLPLNCEGTRTTGVVFGTLPPMTDLQAVNDALSAVPEAQAFEVSSDKNQLYVLAVFLRERQAAVDDILRTLGFSASSLKTLGGTAAENIGAAAWSAWMRSKTSPRACGSRSLRKRRGALTCSALTITWKLKLPAPKPPSAWWRRNPQ